MKPATLSCTFYYDYISGYNEEWSYNKALVLLNKQFKELLDKNKITVLYKNKKNVRIIPEITLKDVGNIFSLPDLPKWEVDIRVEVDCDPETFESSKLRFGKCPDWIELFGIGY